VSSDVRGLEVGLADGLEGVARWVEAAKIVKLKTHLLLLSRKGNGGIWRSEWMARK